MESFEQPAHDNTMEIYDLAYYEQAKIERGNPLLGLGAGDSSVFLNVLSADLRSELFEKLDTEIDWNVMTHKGGPVPRLISIQAESTVGGCFPLYRHPADEQPGTINFTPTAQRCREEVSAVLGQRFNHALIQKYRNGKDNISEHADKTLDIERGTMIVNLSVGSTRVMILKSKPDHPHVTSDGPESSKIVQKITLPPNSVFVLGWQTNLLFTHQIKADKRAAWEKRPDERLYNEQRISLTFRSIATFISPDGAIFGQGAKNKIVPDIFRPVPDLTNHAAASDETDQNGIPNKQEEESIELLKAFSVENRSALFDWDAYYGQGFDVVNFNIVNK